MSYDPNWLMKAKTKHFAAQQKSLSHIEKEGRTMICGQGWGAKGHPSITICQFPTLTSLPTCRNCREKWLSENHPNVVINKETGYPN